jgi:hypothetical protein
MVSFHDVKFRPFSVILHRTRYPTLNIPVAEFAKIPRVGPVIAGVARGNIGMFRYHFSEAFPVAEFAKIPHVGPVIAGVARGNIGMFRLHFSEAFPVAEFAKIPRVGPVMAGAARGTLACSATIFRDHLTSVTSWKSIPDSPHRFEHPWLPRIVSELFA